MYTLPASERHTDLPVKLEFCSNLLPGSWLFISMHSDPTFPSPSLTSEGSMEHRPGSRCVLERRPLRERRKVSAIHISLCSLFPFCPVVRFWASAPLSSSGPCVIPASRGLEHIDAPPDGQSAEPQTVKTDAPVFQSQLLRASRHSKNPH